MFIAQGLTFIRRQATYPGHPGAPASPANALEQSCYVWRRAGKDDQIDISNIDSNLQGSGGKT
jgi:hypothetical protein